MTAEQVDILKEIYIPSRLADLQIQSQDIVAVSSNMYVLCGVDALIHHMSTLFTTEGISALIGRTLAAYPFQITAAMNARKDPDISTAEKWEKIGSAA